MAWMEHGLQIPLKTYALAMQDKMAARNFGMLQTMSEMGLLKNCTNVHMILFFSGFSRHQMQHSFVPKTLDWSICHSDLKYQSS